MQNFETLTPKSSRESFGKTEEELKKVNDSIDSNMSADELLAAASRKKDLEQTQETLSSQAYEEASLINEAIDQGRVTDLGKVRESQNVDTVIELLRKEKIESKQAERSVSPEQLQTNLEILEANIAKMDKIPESVLQSPEGQEATQSLMERMTGKLAGFRDSMAQKLSTLDSWEGKDKMVTILGGVAGAAILGPLVLQMARSKWPEVGVALDAAPEALQQLIHMDIWAKIAELLGNGDMVQNDSIWKNGGIEVSNLLADISSGKETLSSLQSEQLQVLQDGMNAENFAILTSPQMKDPAHYATVINSTVVRTLANIGPIGAAGIGMYGVMSKIGALASKYKKETI